VPRMRAMLGSRGNERRAAQGSCPPAPGRLLMHPQPPP
jgi:hypothetical protein